jgi:hypothetical protein
MKRLLLLSFILLHSAFVIPAAHAQRALLKNPSSGALVEGFASGANTLELSATGTLKFNSGFTLTGGSYLKSALSLGNVENTALSTWAGSTNLTTLGTITAGTWQGGVIAPAYLGTGSSITTKYLRGDGTWQTVAGGGLEIGVSTITSGTNGYVLYNNGGDLGELPVGFGGGGVLDNGKIAKYNADGRLTTTGGFVFAQEMSGLTHAIVATDNLTVADRTITFTFPDADHAYVFPSTGGTPTLISTGNLSAITTVGTITSGTWQGTDIALAYLAQGGATDGQALVWDNGAGTWEPGTISAGLTINTTAVSGASANDLLISDGTTLQKITPGTGVAAALANAVNGSGGLLTYSLISTANTWSAAQTVASGTIATSAPGISITQTWNGTNGTGGTSFTGLLLDITNTSSANGLTSTSWLVEAKIGGSTVGGFRNYFNELACQAKWFELGSRYNALEKQNDSSWSMKANDAVFLTCYDRGLQFDVATGLHWSASSSYNTSAEVSLYRLATRSLIERAGTSSTSLQVANTWTSNTDYESAGLWWESNVAYMGTQKGSGGGSARDVSLVRDSTVKVTVGANTTDHAQPVKLPSYTVGGLPSAATCGAGAMAFVTDATSTTAYATVSGGGSNKVLVISDGTDWIIH